MSKKSYKIALILPCNLYVVPYFSVYEDALVKAQVSFDVILWNRDLIEEECAGRIIGFNCKDVANDKNAFKTFKYLSYYSFVKKAITEGKYDKLVFLSTSAWTVVLLSSFLKKCFANKYWIDVRDYTFEHIPLYKRRLATAIEYSSTTAISSRGFLSFLPSVSSKEYLVTHNIDFNTIEKIRTLRKKSSANVPIRISFIGNNRYIGINKKLMIAFKNDSRFILQYFGTRAEELETFAYEEGINNVRFHGRFQQEDTYMFYLKTDIINNVYGNESQEVVTALSNKLYYAVFLNLPILVSPNTFMSEITRSVGIGYDVELNDKELPQKVYDWYQDLDQPNEQTTQLGDQLLSEFQNFEECLSRFVGEYR